jgi:hypothetical protein
LADYLINCLKGFLSIETWEHVAYGHDHTWTSPEALLYRVVHVQEKKTYIGRSRILAGCTGDTPSVTGKLRPRTFIALAQGNVTPTIILGIFLYFHGKISINIKGDGRLRYSNCIIVKTQINLLHPFTLFFIKVFQLHNRQNTNQFTPPFYPIFQSPCCSSLDPTTKYGVLGSPADLGQPDDVLVPMGPSRARASMAYLLVCSKTSRFFVTQARLVILC